MRIFDLHCDTAYEMAKRNVGFTDSRLHINRSRISAFDEVTQVFAFWCDRRMSDEECWKQFFIMRQHFLSCEKSGDLPKNMSRIFAVEDARLLAGDLSRLRTLYDCGVRILTLQWQGDTCIGGGFDTKSSLTQFGRDVVRECFWLGIVPDVSHASREVTDEVLELADRRAVIASHSDSFSLCAHPRNLTDEHFMAIRDCKGVVGVNLVPSHLTRGDRCDVGTVCDHMEHFLSLGGEDTVCLGCDFDGTDQLPDGISGIDCTMLIYNELLKRGISEAQVEKVFFSNAQAFAEKNISPCI